MTPQAQAELDRQYRAARSMFDSGMDALRQIVASDFPEAENPAAVTRYDVDMMRGLAQQIAALVAGYERRLQ